MRGVILAGIIAVGVTASVASLENAGAALISMQGQSGGLGVVVAGAIAQALSR